MHINNPASICSTSNHINGIDRNKFHTQRFKSRYLMRYSTKIHDSSCSLLYVARSTSRISRFHGLEDSNSYLLDDAVMKSSSSSPDSAKQVFYSGYEDGRKVQNESIVLQESKTRICHEWALSSRVAILKASPRSILKQIFNSTYGWWLSQEKPKGSWNSKEKLKKSLKNFERIWDFWLWFWDCDCGSEFSVMIRLK